jgi:hypothetical protein
LRFTYPLKLVRQTQAIRADSRGPGAFISTGGLRQANGRSL